MVLYYDIYMGASNNQKYHDIINNACAKIAWYHGTSE